MESPSDGAGRHHPYTSPSEAPARVCESFAANIVAGRTTSTYSGVSSVGAYHTVRLALLGADGSEADRPIGGGETLPC